MQIAAPKYAFVNCLQAQTLYLCSHITAMKQQINIAIDGHASCGKSTLAKAIARQLGYTYIDSGAMYRAVTLYFLRHPELDFSCLPDVETALQNVTISFTYNPETGMSETLLNGENVENDIRGREVSSLVSQISTIAEVRRFLVKQQQELGKNKGVVMDGRDIGTVVFPDAELKIFLTANLEVRAQRRYSELVAKGQQVTLEEVKQNLQERDITDSTREITPLLQAPDAILIDNSYITREEQLQLVLELVNKKIKLTEN
ncbi:cytidylate kinase [Sphingobacteriales bacterium TSM_CSM]|nr:cytidylate kinase [Sphingobacteriales bacterium TSM_CSM]